jgi:hypothetical protein
MKAMISAKSGRAAKTAVPTLELFLRVKMAVGMSVHPRSCAIMRIAYGTPTLKPKAPFPPSSRGEERVTP